MPGLINLDFADVRSVMGEMGKAMMGTGEAEGDGRALQAAEKAIANPLLDGVSMRGAKGVIVSIVGGDDMRLMEVDEAANHIRELVDPDANIIWGSAFNDGLNGKIRVSVVATGIDSEVGNHAAPLTQPFSFASRPAVAVPQAAPVQTRATVSVTPPQSAAPVAAPAPAPQAEALELNVPEAPAPVQPAVAPQPAAAQPAAAPAFAPPRPAAVFSDEDPEQDELILGADSAAPAAPAPAAPAQPAPRVATGGTLFERMAGLTRGSEKAPGADDAGTPGVDIPRFLNRQSNQ
jgi:cell division protein FtsZ